MTQIIKLPQMRMQADFKPETLDKEKRTIEVVFSTGARGRRDSYWDGPFFEELGMEPGNVRMERFENGASVLDSHNRYNLSSVLGVITEARLENGIGYATVKFSSRDEVQGTVTDVMEGVIRNLSVGYKIHKMEKVGEENDIPIFRATDWEPSELSFVSVPFDVGSQTRNEDKDEKLYSCEIINRESKDMKKPVQSTKDVAPAAPVVEGTREVIAPVVPKIDVDAVRTEAIAAERTRCVEIREACSKSKMESEFVTKMIDDGTSIEDVRTAIIDQFAEKDSKVNTRSTNVTVGADLGREGVRAGVQASILNRVDGSVELDENSRQYRGMSLIDMARSSLEAANINTRGMDRFQVAKLSLRAGYNSTSDFPLILENTVGKSLQKAYTEAPRTWEPLAVNKTVSDFKEVAAMRLGEFSQLDEVLEGGEYKHGKLSEAAERYSISKYGKMIAVTYEMIVNDDMSAFTSIPTKMGKKARDLESDKVWALITANAQVMAETGSTLFHANHNNLNEGGAGVVSEASLAAIREAMRLHEDLGGTSPLNLFPTNIWVPASREVETMKLLRSITPNQSSQVNVFGQDAGFSLMAMVEPRLDAVGTKGWLVGASKEQIESVVVARLAGAEQPMVESREGFEIDGMEFKIRHHFVAHAMDYRGLSFNDGV